MPGGIVNMVDVNGKVRGVPEELVQSQLDVGWSMQTAGDAATRAAAAGKAERLGGVANTIDAYGAGLARGISAGASDVALSALGGRERLRDLKEAHPIASAAGNVVGTATGAIAGVGPAGLAAKGGAAAARAIGTGSTAAKLAGAAVGGGIEGVAQGFGDAVSELTLSDNPVTWERAASVIGSNVLFGGSVGALTGGAFKAGEIGLGKAKAALDDIAARGASAGDDAVRVAERQSIADDVASHRAATKDSKIWLATEGATERSLRETRKISLEADKALDRTLRNPKALASEPKRALAALQQEEHALEQLAKQGEALRPTFAGDTSAARAAALDAIPAALERNRTLQQRIADAVAPPLAAASGKSLPEQLLSTSVFGTVAGAVSSLPVPGSSVVGAWLGAKAANVVTDKLFGRIAKVSGEQAARGSRAIESFMSATRQVAPIAPVAATKVLSSVSFGRSNEQPATSKTPRAELANAYKSRSAEIRSLVEPGPMGHPVMRPAVRQQVAAQLAPVRAAAPLLADRLETVAVRRAEFLASKLPRKPDVFGMQIGPDRWQPSDMDMRQFARYVAAIEDPMGVIERLADGSLTPEDGEAMRSVYPELMADMTRQIIEKLPTLRESLPYSRRLSLSMFTGVPVDPALDPRVLSVLQSQYVEEESGRPGPVAQPKFGSVSKSVPEPTPAQARAG